MIFKFIIKLLLKLLFFGRAAFELSTKEFRDKASSFNTKLDEAEKEGNETFQALYQRMNRFEESLSGSMESLQKKVRGNGADPVPDVNELRAELAELRADMRELKRRFPVSAPDDNGN